jgi:hypothetical protein
MPFLCLQADGILSSFTHFYEIDEEMYPCNLVNLQVLWNHLFVGEISPFQTKYTSFCQDCQQPITGSHQSQQFDVTMVFCRSEVPSLWNQKPL